MIDLKKSFKNIFKNILVQFLSFLFLLSGLGIGYAAWTTLTSNQGATGQPVNQTLMQGIINNLNDLNTRVATLGTSNGGIGYGQTWQDLTSSRKANTNYTNNTGKPIMVNYYYYALNGPMNSGVYAVIDGVTIYGSVGIQGYSSNNLSFIVPNGSTYRIEGYNPTSWVELR
ncbi:MAG: hypothetical protein PHI37_02340 [Candidatus Gracilibacteria bacterium]|nr:hypothetical protein [Candidatus Gracilibacteria bacterium]